MSLYTTSCASGSQNMSPLLPLPLTSELRLKKHLSMESLFGICDCLLLVAPSVNITTVDHVTYEGWNFNSGNYLFTTDTK